MEPKDIIEELRRMLVTRLRFDPARATDLADHTPLPKGLDGSAGLDSLDFIELSIAIEERFGFTIDESEDLGEHFATLATLSRFIRARAAGG